MQAELILDARCGTGESPVWSVEEQALYWVDIPACQLHRIDPASGAHKVWTGDEMLACVAPRAGHPGQWIAGMESGLFAIATQENGTLAATPVANVAHALPGMRFNDGRCDRQGRFWAGTMLMDMAAAREVRCSRAHTPRPTRGPRPCPSPSCPRESGLGGRSGRR